MRYEIGNLVGAGGMGVVYRAFDRMTRAEVVVKFLREELLDESVTRARFAAEVRAVKRLCHPNLARFVDGGPDFLVMKPAPGTPLGLPIADTGAFALPRITAIGDQLLRALAHAHAHDVVHADVKSDNVLLDPSDHATLIDFGVARLLDEPLALIDPMLSGTPDYMAPEVILGRAPGPSADIYAVGVILYELLTGTTPFGGGTSAEIMTRSCRREGRAAVGPPAGSVHSDRARARDHARARKGSMAAISERTRVCRSARPASASSGGSRRSCATTIQALARSAHRFTIVIDLKALPRFLELPVLSLQTAVVFPHASRSIVLNRPSLMRAVESLKENDLIAVAAQKNPDQEEPRIEDLHPIGTVAIVRRPDRIPEFGGAMPIALDGIGRIRLGEELQRYPFLRARVERIESLAPDDDDASFGILRTRLVELVAELVTHSLTLPDDLVAFARQLSDAGALADVVASGVVEVSTERHTLLAELDVRRRVEKLIEIVRRERTAQRLRDELHTEVEERIGERQRELLLREQLSAIRKELGETDEGLAGVATLRESLRTSGLTPEAMTEAERELERLGHMSLGSPEYSLSRTYLETLASLPWTKLSSKSIDLKRASSILDEDHFDLQKVKERILEFLAVQKLNAQLKAPVLCLVGPPGVGKTSLGASMARAMRREFVRVSLGGVHDEAEIRGHRRTYVGAMPGQILRGLQRAGARDPLFLLDEVDKLGREHHGDPYAALLEVLDPDQNAKFHDNYIDVPFDLSRVLFVCTANFLEPLPPALRDRMEILELPGYVEDEKLQIAVRHLVPRVAADHGLAVPRDIQFEAGAIREIIGSYTHEAGVRKLEQHIAAICRKRARQLAESRRGRRLVTPTGVRKLLGVPLYRSETELVERTREPGVAIGLAWTPAGGDTLLVEARRIPRGRGKLTFTGQLGDVMEESAKAAVTWVRASAESYGIDAALFGIEDLHVHFPSGSIPKDGPSAGVVLATALISLYTERAVSSHVAMTGEITLSGHLLPVSGLKEKLLAARRSGITDVVLPAANEPDVREDVPPHIYEGLTIHYAKTIEAALKIAIPSSTVASHPSSRRHSAAARHAYAARSQR